LCTISTGFGKIVGKGGKGVPKASEELASDLAKHWQVVADTFQDWAGKSAEVSGSANRLTYTEWVGSTADLAGRMAGLWLQGVAIVTKRTYPAAVEAFRPKKKHWWQRSP
jgi:hypothetical protein